MTETKTTETTICNICGCVAKYPFRAHNAKGEIISGCTALVHTSHLTRPDDIAWHERPDAVAHRMKTGAMRQWQIDHATD